MGRFLERAFLIILSLALLAFIFFLIEEVVVYTSKDYQYALIGALGSLIGGSLTLAGVWWTLRNQAKTDFVNEFPRKIRSLHELIADIERFNENQSFFAFQLFGNQEVTYNQRVRDFKALATDVDGTSYFIICKMDDLYQEYYAERGWALEFERGKKDNLNRPAPTQESAEKLRQLQDKFNDRIEKIGDELKEHSEELMKLFLKYKGGN